MMGRIVSYHSVYTGQFGLNADTILPPPCYTTYTTEATLTKPADPLLSALALQTK